MTTPPQLAAQLYTVREFTQTRDDLRASLTKIRNIGYPAVQVSGIGNIPDSDVKAIADDLGLKICITHVRPAEALWKHLDAVIAQHHLWNCRHVGLGMMPQAYRDEGESGYRRFAADATRIGERLAEAGLTFNYHNHSFELERFGTRTGLDIIFEESDPRYLNAILDTYWIQHGGGDSAAWIRRMTGRMPVVHFKDMVIVNGEQAMAEVGEGNLNWPEILRACEEAGVEWYAVEQDTCRRDPFDSLKISFEHLKTFFARSLSQ